MRSYLPPLGLLGALAAACGSNSSGGTASGGEGGQVVVTGGAAGIGAAAGAAGQATGGVGGAGGATAGNGGVAGSTTQPFDGPLVLSETGLYADILTRELNAGVEPYSVRYELWTDTAVKRRYVSLPAGESIDTTVPDRWRFPVGTKAWKEFERDGTLVETRLMEKVAAANEPESWRYVAYRWRADGTDADALPGGELDARSTDHDIPDQDACRACHGGNRDFFLGLGAIQLAGAGGLLETWQADGRLTQPLPSEPDVPGAGVVVDALGYLHANCGHCHSQDYAGDGIGGGGVNVPLRMNLRVSDVTPEDTLAYITTIDASTRHVIDGTDVAVVPGKPLESQLYVRAAARNDGSMPPLGTEMPDDAGLQTLRSWIEQLAAN